MNMNVKNCPNRLKENHAFRGEIDDWVYRCKIQHIPPEVAANTQDVFCHLHGNCKLGKCTFYNEWSLEEVRKAFKKLDEAEAHRDAVIGVLRM